MAHWRSLCLFPESLQENFDYLFFSFLREFDYSLISIVLVSFSFLFDSFLPFLEGKRTADFSFEMINLYYFLFLSLLPKKNEWKLTLIWSLCTYLSYVTSVLSLTVSTSTEAYVFKQKTLYIFILWSIKKILWLGWSPKLMFPLSLMGINFKW